MSTQDRAYHIIKKPVVSEKANFASADHNTYHLRVPMDANKVEIRQAVERLFSVKVASVNTLSVPTKWRRRGYSLGKSQAWKKAMVKLQEGSTIDIY